MCYRFTATLLSLRSLSGQPVLRSLQTVLAFLTYSHRYIIYIFTIYIHTVQWTQNTLYSTVNTVQYTVHCTGSILIFTFISGIFTVQQIFTEPPTLPGLREEDSM